MPRSAAAAAVPSSRFIQAIEAHVTTGTKRKSHATTSKEEGQERGPTRAQPPFPARKRRKMFAWMAEEPRTLATDPRAVRQEENDPDQLRTEQQTRLKRAKLSAEEDTAQLLPPEEVEEQCLVGVRVDEVLGLQQPLDKENQQQTSNPLEC